ncbi:MAG: hypothetical protein VW516_00225 [Rhodospirillaceae bacterium]
MIRGYRGIMGVALLLAGLAPYEAPREPEVDLGEVAKVLDLLAATGIASPEVLEAAGSPARFVDTARQVLAAHEFYKTIGQHITDVGQLLAPISVPVGEVESGPYSKQEEVSTEQFKARYGVVDDVGPGTLEQRGRGAGPEVPPGDRPADRAADRITVDLAGPDGSTTSVTVAQRAPDGSIVTTRQVLQDRLIGPPFGQPGPGLRGAATARLAAPLLGQAEARPARQDPRDPGRAARAQGLQGEAARPQGVGVMEAEEALLSVIRILSKVGKDARRRVLLALFAFFGEDLP